jgi:hypothetical protein|tara:strand:+ start:1071 stop:1250 length:180 start_codon:yes stop_codon:yes gene_type:complete
MVKEVPKWVNKPPQRNDLKKLLTSTKKFAEMYLNVLNEKRDVWINQLEKQKEQEQEDKE